MKIGLNLLYLLPGIVGGTETYAAGLLNGLSRVDVENEYVVFVNSESASWPMPGRENFRRILCPVKASNRAGRYFFEQVRLPKVLKEKGVDLVHSLGYVGPLRPPCPAVLTLHDLHYLHYRAMGNIIPWCKCLILGNLVNQCARRATSVITVSDFSREEICRELKLAREKVTVTKEAPSDLSQRDHRGEKAEVLREHGVSGPYIVAFAGGALHKNIPRLLEAYGALGGKTGHKLVLIGHLPRDIEKTNLPESVVATGYVPSEHLSPLLAGAEVFVLPSLYEGFGLPALEAQQAGVPVVCSNVASLPEVAGEGALFFNPLSVQEMAEAIARVLKDKTLRENLQKKGFENVARFSWEKTARETVAVYERVYGRRGQR